MILWQTYGRPKSVYRFLTWSRITPEFELQSHLSWCGHIQFNEIIRIFLACSPLTILHWHWTLFWLDFDLEKEQRWYHRPFKNWCTFGFCWKNSPRNKSTASVDLLNMVIFFLWFKHSESKNSSYGSRYWRMDQVKFVEDSL